MVHAIWKQKFVEPIYSKYPLNLPCQDYRRIQSQCYDCRPQPESSANNTLERPLKRRKSRGSRGSKNKRKGDGGGGGGGGGGGEEATPKRQSREYRDAIISMKRDSKKKPPEPGDKTAEAVTEAAEQPKEVNIQVSSAKKFSGKRGEHRNSHFG